MVRADAGMVDFEGLNIKINFFGFTRLYQALLGLTGGEPVRNRGSRVELIQIIGFDSNLPMRMTPVLWGKSSKSGQKPFGDWPDRRQVQSPKF